MPYARKLAAATLIFVLGLTGGYFFAVYRFRDGISKAPAGKKLGPWQATFRLPASIRVPLEDPVLVLELKRDEPLVYERLKLTVTNLTDRSFTVRLDVYGYDSMGIRESGDIERFSIGPREKLTREVMLGTYEGSPGSLGLPPGRMASSFALSVEVEE